MLLPYDFLGFHLHFWCFNPSSRRDYPAPAVHGPATVPAATAAPALGPPPLPVAARPGAVARPAAGWTFGCPRRDGCCRVEKKSHVFVGEISAPKPLGCHVLYNYWICVNFLRGTESGNAMSCWGRPVRPRHTQKIMGKIMKTSEVHFGKLIKLAFSRHFPGIFIYFPGTAPSFHVILRQAPQSSGRFHANSTEVVVQVLH